MASLNISLPDPMRAFVEAEVAKGGFGTASEYIRHLIREAQKDAAQNRLEQLLLEGLDSGTPIVADEEYWRRLKADLIAKHEQRAKRA